jgi:hypothetical protein
MPKKTGRQTESDENRIRLRDFGEDLGLSRSDHKNGQSRRARRRPRALLHTHRPPRSPRASRSALQAHLRIGECKSGVGEV